jgi:hypothetical protein
MQFMRNVFSVLFLLAGLESATLLGQELPSLNSVTVRTTVEYSSSAKVFTYRYVVSSPPSNNGNIGLVELDISQPAGGATLGAEGLTNGSGYLDGLSRLAQRRSKNVLMIPVGLQAPLEWGMSLGVNGTAGWLTEDDSELHPGHTLSGFQVDSHGLPGLRTMKASAYVDVDDLPVIPPDGSPADTERYSSELDQFQSRARATAIVVGPTAPPAAFSAQAFLETIIGYKEQSLRQGWIANHGIAMSLDAKLNVARAALRRGDNRRAVNMLKSLLHDVEEQGEREDGDRGRKQLAPEAVALLKSNTEYLIDHIGNP